VQFHRLRTFLPVAAVAGLAAVVAAGASAAPSPRATLTGSAPPWATSSNFKGATSTADSVGFRVYLGWRGNAAATAAAVSTPGSASYRHYLTPQQFRQQFSPSQSDVNTVKNWLTSQGFTVDYTPSNNLYVEAEGTVAQASAAFGVTFDNYSVDGLTLRAPSSDISVPSSLAGTVDAVIGLDESAELVHFDHVTKDSIQPVAGFRNAPPCSAYWGATLATSTPKFNGKTLPYAPCGYDATMLRSAYGLGDASTARWTGANQTVAIIDAYASPTILQDANTYSDHHGLPEFQGSQFSQVVAPGTFRHPEAGRRPDPQGWSTEETLDVEAVHSMAPGANVVYVGAANNLQDLDAALNHVVDRHLAQIVTNSYGWDTELLPTGFIKPYEDVLVQAAAEGIGVYFSSGDNGDETQYEGYRTADWPASSPWVTAVGGTSLGVGATNNYLWETYWGTDKYTLTNNSWSSNGWWYAAGGGTSRLFAEPPYQDTVVPSEFTGYFGGDGRVLPDVSMVGDPTTGILMGQTQSFPDGTYYGEFREGGTSLSSPLFAGVMADADQALGTPHGFVNGALYALSGTAAFRDVAPHPEIVGAVRNDYVNSVDASDGITTSVRTIGDTLTLTSKAGFDDANGLGSPNGQTFLSALSH
jgi:subtilase family serine protease